MLKSIYINSKYCKNLLSISGAAAESTDPDQNKKLQFLVFMTFITAGA
jgi:hypothetical protein